MNTEQKEILQLAIMQVLDSNRTRFGLEIPAITTHLVKHACTPTRDEVLDQVDYLERKGFCEEVMKGISKANRAWRLTDAGRDYLDQRGL